MRISIQSVCETSQGTERSVEHHANLRQEVPNLNVGGRRRSPSKAGGFFQRRLLKRERGTKLAFFEVNFLGRRNLERGGKRPSGPVNATKLRCRFQLLVLLKSLRCLILPLRDHHSHSPA